PHQAGDGSLGDLAQIGLQLRKSLLDRVHVRAVGRQISQFGPCGFYELFDPRSLVGRQIVHDDDIALREGGNQSRSKAWTLPARTATAGRRPARPLHHAARDPRAPDPKLRRALLGFRALALLRPPWRHVLKKDRARRGAAAPGRFGAAPGLVRLPT